MILYTKYAGRQNDFNVHAQARWLLELMPLLGVTLSVAAQHQTDLLRLRVGIMLSAIPWMPYCAAIGLSARLYLDSMEIPIESVGF